MLHRFSTLAWLGWLFLTSLFLVLCFQDVLFPKTTKKDEVIAWCGTSDSADIKGVDLRLGKTIFRNNCASCHAGDMKSDLTGPALSGMRTRWQDHGGDEALYAFIRNAQQMIEADTNARARVLWEEWGPTVMNSFEQLTEEEFDALVEYVEAVY